MAVLAKSFSEEKFYSSPSLCLLWDALNLLPFSRAVPALLSSMMVPNLRRSSYDSCPAASTLAFSPSGKALGACRAGRMTSPVPDTAENTEGRRDPKYSCSYCLQIPPHHLPGTHTYHTLPVARELPLPTAPGRFPAPFPTLPTSTGHGCGHGELCADTGTVRVILSSVAQNTREGCAQWQTEVTQAQSRAKHFRPQNGRGTTWVLKPMGSAAGTSPGLC